MASATLDAIPRHSCGLMCIRSFYWSVMSLGRSWRSFESVDVGDGFVAQ